MSTGLPLARTGTGRPGCPPRPARADRPVPASLPVPPHPHLVGAALPGDDRVTDPEVLGQVRFSRRPLATRCSPARCAVQRTGVRRPSSAGGRTHAALLVPDLRPRDRCRDLAPATRLTGDGRLNLIMLLPRARSPAPNRSRARRAQRGGRWPCPSLGSNPRAAPAPPGPGRSGGPAPDSPSVCFRPRHYGCAHRVRFTAHLAGCRGRQGSTGNLT